MELKKNPDVDVSRNSSLYFAIGLNIMLLTTWSLFEYKSYDNADLVLDTISLEELFEEEIPITKMKTPPPPPPITISEAVTIIEDVIDVEETIIESTETGQDDIIEERVVGIDEVNVDDIEEDIEVPFAVLETVPIFPGCEGGTKAEIKACFQVKIRDHVQKNFKYPKLAQELGINGKVYVVFVIDKDGNITNIRSRGPDKLLENEAERIVGLLPKMIPGKQRGRPVRVPYSLPIHFKYVRN